MRSIASIYVLISYFIYGKRFQHCIDNNNEGYIEKRRLVIATCETGTHAVGWMKNDSLFAWNVTSSILRKQGVPMFNVCDGKSWEYKLLTKPLSYLAFTQSLMRSLSAADQQLMHVIFMDSDTYWSVVDVSEVWNRYDCARNGKDMVVSTETACWMGFYCTKQDIQYWYGNIQNTPSYSPFANSGIYMGKLELVYQMLEYIVANNQTYYTLDTFHKVMKFHDQHAVADYSIKINPSRIQLDYHQQFAATFAVRVSEGKAANKRATAVCKTSNNTLDYHCTDITAKLSNNRFRFYRIEDSTCRTYRHFSDSLPHMNEIEGFAAYPIAWHGNGAAKKAFLALSLAAYKCHMRKSRQATVYKGK
jgi:hypothetical protein